MANVNKNIFSKEIKIDGSFLQQARHHLSGCGCPYCRESKGEIKLCKLLSVNNIKYIRQYKFDECKYIKKLPFDFYLPEYHICIEYNGRQHYEPVEAFGGEKEYENVKLRDEKKKEYCKNNNIKLIVFKYDQSLDDIKNILHNLKYEKHIIKYENFYYKITKTNF